MAADLVTVLETIAGKNGFGRARAGAKCFVALPYSPDFDRVWEGLLDALRKRPYNWDMVRADWRVEGPDILQGILQHLGDSSRFIADVSGLNANVLIELGMMLHASRGTP